jgi:hypothetical protein
VLARLLAEWRALGIEPEVQEGWVMYRGVLALVRNVIAVLPADAPAGAGAGVLLAAHYDSVPAGPGASDDMLGVATQLEAARVLQADKGRRRDVVFLASDGEEAALLGARLFCKRHPLRSRIGAAVNVEARGTSGPSLMFETHALPWGVLAGWSGAAARPVSSSLFARIYEQMPNDTDFTVFTKDLGVAGVNFACIGSVQHYHTPLDSLANVEEGTLVHHLDNALAAVRAFLAEPPGRTPGDEPPDLVWADWAGAGVLAFPRRYAGMVALIPLALLIASVTSELRKKRLGVLKALAGLGHALLAPALAAGLAFAACAGLSRAGALPDDFVANARPAILAVVLLALLAIVSAGVAGGRFAGSAGLAAGARLVLALLLAACTWLEQVAIGPIAIRHGELVPILVPTVFAAGFLGLLAAIAPRLAVLRHLANVVPLLVLVLQLAPVAYLGYDALGVQTLPILAGLTALASLPALPYAAVSRGPGLLGVFALFLAALACGIATLKLQPRTPHLPGRGSIVYVQEQGKGAWSALAAPRPKAPELPGPLPEPTIEVLEDTGDGRARNLVVALRSRRGAPFLRLELVGAMVDSFAVDGVDAEVEAMPRNVWACRTLPKEGLVVRFRLPLGGKVQAKLEDRTYDLPSGGDAMRAARPASFVPSQEGDHTTVKTRVTL